MTREPDRPIHVGWITTRWEHGGTTVPTTHPISLAIDCHLFRLQVTEARALLDQLAATVDPNPKENP